MRLDQNYTEELGRLKRTKTHYGVREADLQYQIRNTQKSWKDSKEIKTETKKTHHGEKKLKGKIGYLEELERLRVKNTHHGDREVYADNWSPVGGWQARHHL